MPKAQAAPTQWREIRTEASPRTARSSILSINTRKKIGILFWPELNRRRRQSTSGLDSPETNSVSGTGGGYKAGKFRFLLFL
jgi:hypothetical protein